MRRILRQAAVRIAPTVPQVCLLGALLGLAAPANAQIYSWRDGNGHLVLSNRQPGGAPVRSYAVPKTEAVRATRPVVASRSLPFEDLIDEQSRLHSVRPALVRAVMQVESAFNPLALSPKGAMGLMQLMPATARQYGVRDAFNPFENVRGGVAYLRGLLDRYQNDETLALAAYNAGPTAVDRHGQSVPPYRETRNYVTQINQMAGHPKPPSPLGLRGSNRIYKVTDTVDGREIPLYTDKRPSRGAFAVLDR